jgi:hypothetical protein
MARSFDEVSKSYSSDVQAIAARARTLITGLMPTAEETVDPTADIVSYGFGSGYRGMICTIIFSKGGVKLGLVGGAKLPDPERLLQGRGKTHKYVDLRTVADVSRPGVERLIKSALDASRRLTSAAAR